MAEIEKKPVKIVETVLRDAHQSLLATRMTTEQMLPIVDKMDKVLLFRGAITRALLQQYNPTKAILISALLFGVFHINPCLLYTSQSANCRNSLLKQDVLQTIFRRETVP